MQAACWTVLMGGWMRRICINDSAHAPSMRPTASCAWMKKCRSDLPAESSRHVVSRARKVRRRATPRL